MATAAIQHLRDVLAGYPGLAASAVLAHQQDDLGEVLVGYLVPGGPGLDLAELHQQLREQLPGTELPADLVVVDEIPLDANGIADPQALPAPDLRGLARYRPPDTTRQRALCAVFAEVLSRPRCGIDDNFFNLGGESIDAMLIASRISLVVGQDISMNEVFDAPTVAELDRLLDKLLDDPSGIEGHHG